MRFRDFGLCLGLPDLWYREAGRHVKRDAVAREGPQFGKSAFGQCAGAVRLVELMTCNDPAN
jgi:hypothetical protein